MNDVKLYIHEESPHGRELLTQEECERADRFIFPEDRDLFTTAHALLHKAIGDGAIETVANGRPELVDRAVRFNLSHTRGLAVVAVTATADIGVDVEDTQRRSDGLRVADRFFAPAEVAALFALPEAQRRERFFRYWTLKEAYIKARGLGLAIPLDSFAFAFDPLRLTAEDAPRWAFHQEQIGRHMLALCVQAPLGRIERVDVRL